MPFHEFLDPIPPVHPVEADAWKSTYRAPSVVQEQLAQTLNSCRKGLTCLEDEEKRLVAHLKAVSQAKLGLNLRVHKLEAAIAPYRKLPPELLSRIFELNRDDELYLPPKNLKIMGDKPFRAQQIRKCRPEHVCSLWRQVAQQTPMFIKDIWPSVSISYHELSTRRDASFPSSLLALAGLSREIISRGTHTLHINFGPGIREKLAARWVPDHELLDLTVRRGSPHLEMIVIETGDLSQAFLDASVGLFASLPQLTSVTLEFIIDYDWKRSFPLHKYPLHNLTELKVFPSTDGPSIISSDGFYQILRSLPRLETCFVQLSCNDHLPTYEPAREAFEHGSLRDVSIYRCYCECTISSFPCDQTLVPFQFLSLPSLRKFEMSTQQSLLQSDLCTFSNFITRSQCQLDICQLETSCSEEQEFIPFLQSEWEALSPYLVNLTSLLAPGLVLPPGAPREIAEGRHLPHLNHLHCQIFEVDQQYQPMLCELMNSRHAGERRWRESYIFVIPDAAQVSSE